ncbi:MAG: hypothetical protein Q8K58_02800 [Acidimicrobiales bacterium]|nr:hypothetical protein [Acidimicrobiales bacterium]
MAVEIRPETFSLVLFDVEEIRALTEQLVAQIGLPRDASVTVEVDETTPLGYAHVTSLSPVMLSLESGALEDPKRPRQMDPVGSADVLGRLLFEVRDRLDPAFGEAPASGDLTLPEASAWQAYCVGRLGRLGHHVQRQRRLYHFRNRHAFSDAADAAFDRLWNGDGLTWADIVAESNGALAAQPA